MANDVRPNQPAGQKLRKAVRIPAALQANTIGVTLGISGYRPGLPSRLQVKQQSIQFTFYMNNMIGIFRGLLMFPIYLLDNSATGSSYHTR